MMDLKALNSAATSVDPDQTAPLGAVWSGSALFMYAILSETLIYKNLGHLSYSRYLDLWISDVADIVALSFVLLSAFKVWRHKLVCIWTLLCYMPFYQKLWYTKI